MLYNWIKEDPWFYLTSYVDKPTALHAMEKLSRFQYGVQLQDFNLDKWKYLSEFYEIVKEDIRHREIYPCICASIYNSDNLKVAFEESIKGTKKTEFLRKNCIEKCMLKIKNHELCLENHQEHISVLIEKYVDTKLEEFTKD